MSCKRVCRELLWLARFGELGPDSQPHLEHLTSCRSCRDEVGFDRAMVEQLRAALAERVANAAPSPGAWEGILARTRASEPAPMGWRAWTSALVGRLRLTAMAASGLALILALNAQVVPMAVPGPSDDIVTGSARVSRTAVRLGGDPSVDDAEQLVVAEASVTDAVGALTSTTPGPASDESPEPPASTDPPAAGNGDVRVVFLPADTYQADWASEPQDVEDERPAPMPAASQPGEPS